MKLKFYNVLKSMKRNKAFTKTLSFVLSLLLLFYVIPSTVFAKAAEALEDTKTATDKETVVADGSAASRGIDPFEVVELREETAKHFRLSDGNYVAAQYNYPVHSLDENGEWQDIDNALTKNGSEFSNESARIKFAKKINGSSTLFALHDGNNKITLNLIGAEKGTKGEVTNRTDAEEDTELQKMMNLEKLSSSIIYRDILDGVDIEYVAYSMNVKENIIVKEKKSSYTYSFELKLNGLTPALTESGDIELSDDDTGEIRYVIPAPVVYDASGVYAPAEASAYTLTHENGKKYVLTIAADSAWMNAEERAFPVVIDPAVNKAGTAATVIDVNINSANPDMQTNNNHELTVMDNSRKMLIHWKTTSLPHVPSSARITEVYVSLRLISGYGAYVGAYEVTTDWDSTLTWNKYKYDHYGASEINLLDYHQMSFSSPYQSWNITEVAKKWYADSADNYGIAFANMSMNTSNATFCSAESDFMPGVTVIYRDMKGLESYWPYSSHSAGTAGDGHVNLANGNLVFTIPTLTATDNIFSYTPYLTYDSNMSNNPYWYVNANVALGTYSVATGFKLSVNETIMSVPLQNGSVNEYYYVYSDADGTEHFFYDQNDGTYRDEDGLGLVMTVESNGDILLVNEAKEIRYFDSVNMLSSSYCWRLTYIEDINGNRLLFTYAASHKPTKISLLPNGHSTPIDLLEFVYHQSTGALLMVYNATAKTATVFRYSYNYNSDIIQNGYRYLRQIDYAVGNTDATSNDFYNFALNAVSDTNIEVYDSASYNYNSSGKLTEVINTKSNTSIKYEWNGKYVKKISEYAADTLGNEISFTYHTDSTDVYSNGNDGRLGTTDDIKNSYVIDSYGRCTSAYSSSRDGTAIYGASGYIYDTQENSKNSIKQSSILGGHSTNYIINGSFEDITGTSPSHWSLNGNAYSTTISGVNGTFERSVTMRSTENYNSCISQKLMLSPDTYTLSFPMYVIRGEGMSGKIVIEDYNTHEVIYTEAITPIPHSGEGFFSSTFTIPYTSNQRSVILTIIFYAPSDSDDVHIVEIDSVMLSRSIGTSDYNFIEYGSFEYSLIGNDGNNATISTDYWVDESGNAASIGYTDSTDDKVATIHNSSGGDRYIKQTVYQASSSKLEEYMNSDPAELDKAHHVFSVSGFASASNIAYGMPASLKVVISYYKGAGNTDIEDTYVFHFSPDIDDWQFVSGNVILGYTQDGCPIEDYLGIKSITVYCDCFSNYKASASFNNISMTYVGINAVTNYTYTDDGRIESVVNGKNGQFYKYNDNGNVIATANNNGILVEYVYDINNVNRIKEIVEYSFTFNGESEFPYSYTSDPFAMVTKVLKYKTVYEYDNYGFVTSETIYAPDGNVNISSLSVYTKRTYIYDTDGSSKIFGALLSTKDSLIETKYFYDNATGWLLASVNVGTGDGYAYSYDRMGRLSKVTPGHLTSSNDYNVITSKEHVNYSYDSSNRLSEISTAKTIYVFTYDDFGNTESISIGNKIIAEYEYESHNGKIKRITYGNGYEVEYVYNELEQLAQTKYRTDANSEFVIAYEYKYTADGQVYSLRDNVIGRITVYLYDADGKMVGYKEFDDTDDSAVIWTNISYDGYSRVSNVTNTFTYNSGAAVATDTISGAYTYLDDGKLSNYLICSNLTSNTHYVYDTLDRISSIVYNNAEGSNHLNISYEYSYLTFSSYGTTSYVGTFESTVGNHSTRYDYAYSSDGNLVGMRDYDSNEVVYEYDDLGQLLSEDNDFINARYTYSYDHAGNLVQTTSILYNLSSDLISNTYSYTNSKWGDLLTAFNGVAIFYDKIGNPLRYYNGSPYNFTWQGRRLVGAVTSDKNMSFTYNVDGLRTSKNVNGITTHYIYDGNILLSEYTDTEIIVYIYDALGSPIGFKYRDSSYETDVWDVYWYEKNLQGDIVAIYDTIGTKLVSYAYNAWGITFINYYEDGENTTAIKNNLTYRGYYYDSDLELYYLQSRYYDSKTCRFINADALMSGVTGSLKGYNLYAYCFNNPIAFTDSEGNWPKFFEKVAEIFVAVLESIEAEVATGYGVGFEIEATIHSVDVVIEAIAAQKDFIELDDGNLNRGYKGEISGAIGVSIFELGANISDSHYYSDEKCNCDPWRDSISDKSTCKANQTTISSPSLSIGFGVGLYLGVGANASISINLTELHQRIVSIYKEEI